LQFLNRLSVRRNFEAGFLEDKLKKILEDYSGRVKTLLSNDLIGIYLTGSIALGGYHDGKSDIGFYCRHEAAVR